MITIDDFKKLEIRIGKVVSAEKVAESKKLLRLIFDFGSEQRQILAGISESFPDPSVLVGKEMPVLVNLEPRELMGYKSEGMIVAADADDGPVLLHPEREVLPGSIVG
ncbi:MAG: methionine--tRNA ligase [Patescibacteria group bacterium]|jgi:methionine--tRNA ligase beta chain